MNIIIFNINYFSSHCRLDHLISNIIHIDYNKLAVGLNWQMNLTDLRIAFFRRFVTMVPRPAAFSSLDVWVKYFMYFCFHLYRISLLSVYRQYHLSQMFFKCSVFPFRFFYSQIEHLHKDRWMETHLEIQHVN